jgi:DNA-binding protein YbaB
MNAKVYSSVLLVAILFAISACGATPQGVLPTLAVNPTSEADVQQLDTPTPEVLTFDENQGVEGTPTMNLPAIAETSEAISVPLQQALRQVASIQNLISVSATGDQTGIAVSIEAEIAEADNNETTMAAILAAVQAQSSAVTVIKVGTWVGEVLQKTWIWQNGAWTSV